VQLEASHAHPPAVARLDGAAPGEPAELAVGDAVQPADRRPAIWIEALAAVERSGERLGGEIGGQLGVLGAPPEIGRQHPCVTAVEQRERLRLVARGEQQRLVAELPRRRAHDRY
jgi:hypothetical protein